MSESLTTQDFKEIRLDMAHDPHRPRYHFLAPSNWMNDPHGLVEWEGQYHLFYQYNPIGPFHAFIHWGHAVSDDLVHWRDLPVALVPGPETYDADGCWTGCLVNGNGRPTILYTAVFPQTIAGATSSDGLLTWEKMHENPLIGGPPPELLPLAAGNFRDPFVWRAEEGWEMLVASKIEGTGGQILIYKSGDLRRWEYHGIFLPGDSNQHHPFWQGTIWECPNFLDLGEKQALLVSIQSMPNDHLYTVFFTGRREGDSFLPQTSDILVHGGSFYGPQVMRLSDGRLLMIGWLPEGRSQQACQEAGWNGSHSLPLVLDLRGDGTLAVTPAEELQALRTGHLEVDEIRLLGESERIVSKVSGKALEIEAEFIPYGGAEFGLKVLCSPDGEEETRVVYRHDSGQIFVEREHASLDQRADVNPATMPVDLVKGEPLKLHVFVDHSIIDVFVDGRLHLSCRVYPTREDSDGLRFFSRSGHTDVDNINIWQMAPVWPSERGIVNSEQ